MQITDQNGTAYANVALSSGNKVRFSKTDPFGVERSKSPTWRSHQGYIGGDEDASSGLVHLGAREYDPSTGRFLSADPVLDLADPVQMNGYVYCENNPVTFSDPTGLMAQYDSGGGSGEDLSGYGGPSAEQLAWANGQLGMSITDFVLANVGSWVISLLGLDDVISCFTRGDLWACGGAAFDILSGGLGKLRAAAKVVERAIGAYRVWQKAKEKARALIKMAEKARELARKAAAAKKRAAERAAQMRKKAQEAATRKAKQAAQKTGNTVQKARKDAAKKAESKPQQSGSGNRSDGRSSCEDNSFLPGTQVLMADGTTKPIEQVTNGDQVLATDPETGETAVETVTAEIKGEGLKHLVKVTVANAAGDRLAEVTATDGHPFWVPDLDDWIDAKGLKAGQWLRTSAGTYVQITAIERRTAQKATVHNLTVSDLHTYYVLAGAAAVLVHNCGDTRFVVDSSGVVDDLSNPVRRLNATVAAGTTVARRQQVLRASPRGLPLKESLAPYPYGPDLEWAPLEAGGARFLWLLPIHRSEAEFVASNSLNEFECLMDARGVNVLDPDRDPVI